MGNRAKSIVAWAAAGVVIVVGATTLAIGVATPVAFGWFAYQPLAGDVFTPGNGGIFVSRVAIIGSAILTVGMLAAAFLTGWHFARTRPRSRDTESA
ncbi:hypothetical protein [Microbacterium schleiferi]|uniref:Uncharacterized protein n=1 Tax=Microbacterium schleiferi TaxID=69362 RepID=A0ABU7V4D2_9MICO|nr:hypothetical protein [Micrococcales bacterium]